MQIVIYFGNGLIDFLAFGICECIDAWGSKEEIVLVNQYGMVYNKTNTIVGLSGVGSLHI